MSSISHIPDSHNAILGIMIITPVFFDLIMPCIQNVNAAPLPWWLNHGDQGAWKRQSATQQAPNNAGIVLSRLPPQVSH